MVSTFSPNKNLELPASGDYANTWATPVNADWTALDTALGGTTTVNVVAASGTVALTSTQYRPPNIVFSGTLTANVNYQFPAGVGWFGTVYNNTTGAFTITLSSADGGTTITPTQGNRTMVICTSGGTGVAVASTPTASVAGSTTQVQYNNSGALGASANFTFDGTSVRVGGLKLYGASSGTVTIAAASVAGSASYTLPSADGSAGYVLATNGSGGLSWISPSSIAGVSTFSGGSTGLTPSGATSGVVTLGGALNVANGGTGGTTAATGATGLGLGTASNVQHNSLGIGTAGSGTAGEIRATNNVTAFYSSDERLKENIKPIQDAWATVLEIGGKTFDWKNTYLADHGGEDGYFNRKHDFGCIAQDVERVFPVAVRMRMDGTLALDYEKLCALAFQAIVEMTNTLKDKGIV